MAKQNNDAQPTLKQLQWLLDRMNAGRDPITREQVDVFGRHPGGPILPSECIAVERLPDTYGTRHIGPTLENDGPVHDLAVSLQGELWIATVIDGVSMLISRGTPEGEHQLGITHIGLIADEKMGTMFSPRIVGFRPDGTPITFLKKRASCSDSEYWGDDALLLIRGERAFVGRLPKQCLTAIHITPDGTVLTAHSVSRDQWVIYRNGEEVLGTDRVVSTIWEVEDDVMWTCGPHGGLYAYALRAPMSRQGVRKIAHEQDIRDVFMRDGALCYVTTGSDGRGACLHRRSNGENSSWLSSDGHAYLRGYEEFPDGHVAYIGETVRDTRECWVVDDVAGPGFDRVTGIVLRAGRARYYGCLGRHLYTMELPGVTVPKE